MGSPVQADDRPPRRPVRLRMPWRWSGASGACNAGPDARPRPGAHRGWRAVRPCQHPGAVSLKELGQRSAPRERKKGRPGVPTRGSCTPGRPRLPIVRTRPSFAEFPGRDPILRPDPGRREARYGLGRSPGYRRSTRSSSCSVSPRPASRCDCSSAPAMNATRSRRLSSLNRSELSVGWDGFWFTPTFSPFVGQAIA
jgi:hypothetical protein